MAGNAGGERKWPRQQNASGAFNYRRMGGITFRKYPLHGRITTKRIRFRRGFWARGDVFIFFLFWELLIWFDAGRKRP
jgi:hypothetical protein